jgi:hypothetical protein
VRRNPLILSSVGLASLSMKQAGRLWHGELFAVVVSALIAQIALILAGGADANSGRTDPHLDTGTRLLRLFSYFTVQSNILVAEACLALVLRPDRDGRLWRVLRLDAVLGIAITGVVFAMSNSQDLWMKIF